MNGRWTDERLAEHLHEWRNNLTAPFAMLALEVWESRAELERLRARNCEHCRAFDAAERAAIEDRELPAHSLDPSDCVCDPEAAQGQYVERARLERGIVVALVVWRRGESEWGTVLHAVDALLAFDVACGIHVLYAVEVDS